MKNDKTRSPDEPESKSSSEQDNTKKKKKLSLPPATPLSTPAFSLLLTLVCFSAALIATIINTFIYPFSDSLLAPLLFEVLAVIFPVYLTVLLSAEERSPMQQLAEMGFSRFKIKYIFFTIFSALFLISASTALTILCGGAISASEGVRILGTFTAGENDFSVASPYIILTYAIVPAFCEELLFRGVLFSAGKKVSLPFAVTLSVLLSALFSFDLPGLIPSIFTGAFLTFVLYTTGSIFPCILVHTALNVYNLYLGSNIAAYSLTGHNSFLLFIVICAALLLSAILFFAEAAKTYRAKEAERRAYISDRLREAKKQGTSTSTAKARMRRAEMRGGRSAFPADPSSPGQALLDKEKWREIPQNMLSVLAYRQNLVFLSLIAAIYLFTVTVGFIL